jgi:hypothetical protein
MPYGSAWMHADFGWNITDNGRLPLGLLKPSAAASVGMMSVRLRLTTCLSSYGTQLHGIRQAAKFQNISKGYISRAAL